MAQDLRGLVTGQFGVTFYVDSDAQPLVLSEDIRGGLATYTTAERDRIDGRRLADNMLIFNSTTNRYERLVGGTRGSNGFHTGGEWQEFQTAGAAIDSDDTDSRSNHTRAIVTGRGLGFNRTDSELEITANQVHVFHAVQERNENTTILWSRGDLALVEGDDYFTQIQNGNTGAGRLSDGRYAVFGITQAQYNLIVASGRVGISALGAQALSITPSGGFIAGQTLIPGQTAGQAAFDVTDGNVNLYNVLPNDPAALYYRTEIGQILGGNYVFTPEDDTFGPTTNGNWQKLLEDQAQRRGIETIINTNVSRIDTELADLRDSDAALDTLVAQLRTDLDADIDSDAAAIAQLRTDLDAEIAAREASDDSDSSALADEVAARILSDDSDALGIQRLRGELEASDDSDAAAIGRNRDAIAELQRSHGEVRGGGHFISGQYISLSRTDSDSDTINVDTDAFRLAPPMLRGYESIPVAGTIDTERVIISGNTSTQSGQAVLTVTDRTYLTQTDSEIGRISTDWLRIFGNASSVFFGPFPVESNVDINGTYIRDPRSTKILQITNDLLQNVDPTRGYNSTGSAAAGAQVISVAHGYHSYWLPGGGGFEEGLSLVATNDRGYFSGGAFNDTDDTDLPLNWRVVRGRWFDDSAYAPGQIFSGVPRGSSIASGSPICTYNLFGDSDAKSLAPANADGTIRNLRTADTDFLIQPFNASTPAREPTLAEFNASNGNVKIVGGGQAVFAERNTSTEFFREIFDDTVGATREYVDGRLTEDGIVSIIGNTETLVTYARDLTSFPRPGPFDTSDAANNQGWLLPVNKFILRNADFTNAADTSARERRGRFSTFSNNYSNDDTQHGNALSDVQELWVRGDTTVFRNVLSKMVEDSVVLFTDTDGSNKFYWEIEEAVNEQVADNENTYRLKRKNLKYATGTFDTDARYEVYLKPGTNDLLPGTQIIPESLQPASLHLANNETLVDGQNVVIRRQGDVFLFAIEPGGGTGGDTSGITRSELNTELNRLDLRYRDSDGGNNIDLFGFTTVDSDEVPGSQARVSTTFTTAPGTTIITLAPPSGDSEQVTVTADSTANLADGLRDYFNDNVVGRTVAENVTLSGSTVTWTWRGVGVTDSDTDTGFLYTNNAKHTNNIVTQGTDMVPATYQEGLIDTVQLPSIDLDVRVDDGILPGTRNDQSAAIVLTHSRTTDSEVIGFPDSGRIKYTVNPAANTITIDVKDNSIGSRYVDTDEVPTRRDVWLRPDGPLSDTFNDAMVFQNFNAADSEAHLIVHAGGDGSVPAIRYVSLPGNDSDRLQVALPVRNQAIRALGDSDLWDGHTVRAHLSGGTGSIFTDINNGLVPASGSSNDSDFYLAGDATWRTVPRSMITFEDHQIDVYSDLFRIDYDADSETLTFSASAIDSEQSRPVDWPSGSIAYIPSSNDPALALFGIHLVHGPTYTLTDAGPVNILTQQVDTDLAWRGTFTNFEVQEQFNRILVRYGDIDSDTTFGLGRIPVSPNETVNSTMGSILSVLPATAPITSSIPIISAHFDSDRHGLVPESSAVADSDGQFGYLAYDAEWRDGRPVFGSYAEDLHLTGEIDNVREYVGEHIVGRRWTADSDDIRPRDFRFLELDSTGLRIGTVHSNTNDSDYEAFVTRELINNIDPNIFWGMDIDFTYYDSDNNEFIRRHLRVNSTGNDIQFDSDNDSDILFIATPSGTPFGSNVRLLFQDGFGNTLPLPAAGTIHDGYWNKWIVYGSLSDTPTHVTTAIREYGDQEYNYALLDDSTPTIPVFQGTEARRGVIGTGLNFDSATNTLTAPHGVSLQTNGIALTGASNLFDDPVRTLNFSSSHRISRAGTDRTVADIESLVIPRRYNATLEGIQTDELILDFSTLSLYKSRQTIGALQQTPPLDSEFYFVRLTGATGLAAKTPTELINAASMPEQLVDYDTDGDVDWLQYRVTNAGTLSDYTARYIRDSSNRITHIRIYDGITAGGGISSHSIVATRTYSFTANKTLWTDS